MCFYIVDFCIDCYKGDIISGTEYLKNSELLYDIRKRGTNKPITLGTHNNKQI